MTGDWWPILEDEAADRARETAGAIAAALRDPLTRRATDPDRPEVHAGVALFFGELARIGGREEDAETAMSFLEAAFDEPPPYPALFGGMTGLAWIAHQLAAVGIDADEACSLWDARLNTLLEEAPVQGAPTNYDLISGPVGVGLYCYERWPRPAAQRGLEHVLAALERLAVGTEGGISWPTPPTLIPPLGPKGEGPFFNLGVAHGVAGVIALLGSVCREASLRDRVLPLLEEAVSWLIAQRLPVGGGLTFPAWAPGAPPQHGRVAWCYCDLGIATALLAAARAAGRTDWERSALETALGAAARPLESSAVVDAALCHGATGNGHLFNRLYQATREPRLLAASRLYFQKAFELRGQGSGEQIAGYSGYVPDGGGQRMVWRAEKSLLNGVAGVGLALLAAVHPIEPHWDRMLAVAVPPRPAVEHP